MYSVILAQEARKFYAKAEVSLAEKIARCFQILEQDPHKHPNVKPLTGKLQGRYRYRIGHYRVIYRIDDQNSTALLCKVISKK